MIWLFGATGILLSLAGILGRMTITTAADAFGQMVKAVQQIAAIGALAASGVGVAGGSGVSGVAGLGGTASQIGTAEGGMGGMEAAMGHLNAAQGLNQRAGTLEAMGLHAPAAYNRSLAHGHELAARQAELGERMGRFGGVQTGGQDFGFSSTVNSSIGSNFKGTPDDFQRGFQALSPHISEHGLNPNVLAAQYP